MIYNGLYDSIHNLLQVELDETEHCHPLVPKVDDLVVEQMRRLELSHLIVVPSVELPHDMDEGSPRRAKRLTIPDSAKSELGDEGALVQVPSPTG